MTILFCHICWMKEYKGPDRIYGNFDFVNKTGKGFEYYNFAPCSDDYLYGYVPLKGRMDLSKLGVSNGDTSIDGVTVVWIAPRRKIGNVIIGWYQNATVFRDEIENQLRKGYLYRIRASVGAEKLLPVDARTFRIPWKKGAEWGQSNALYKDNLYENTSFTMGRSCIRYTDELDKDDPFIGRVREYIRNDGFLPADNRKRGGSQDQEKKKKIEQAALDICEEYYKGQGYEVTDVGLKNRGWDLEARSYKNLLKIEVKGLSLSNFSVELTPNEYDKFRDKEYKGDYRLAVVVNACKNNAKLFICSYVYDEKHRDEKHRRWSVDIHSYDKVNKRWLIEDCVQLIIESTDDKGRECWVAEGNKKYMLSIKPRIGASIELKRK